MNLFENIISSDFRILNHTSDLQFVHSESNGDNFNILIPHKSVHVNLGKNLFRQGFQILFCIEDFDVEDNDWFGNNDLFYFFNLLFSLLFFSNFGKCSLVFFIVISEKINIVILFFLLNLLLLLLLLFGFSFEPLDSSLGKVAQSAVVEVQVGVLLSIGYWFQLSENSGVFLTGVFSTYERIRG